MLLERGRQPSVRKFDLRCRPAPDRGERPISFLGEVLKQEGRLFQRQGRCGDPRETVLPLL